MAVPVSSTGTTHLPALEPGHRRRQAARAAGRAVNAARPATRGAAPLDHAWASSVEDVLKSRGHRAEDCDTPLAFRFERVAGTSARPSAVMNP
jgi:hypothetical protein